MYRMMIPVTKDVAKEKQPLKGALTDVFTTGGLSGPIIVFGLLEFNTDGGVTDLLKTNKGSSDTFIFYIILSYY